MRPLTLIAALSLTACTSLAESVPATLQDMTAPIDLSTPEAAAYSMMRAMYQGDAAMVDQVFLEGASLRRVTGEGEVKPDGLQRWRDWVGTLEEGDAHETLFAVTSEQFGNLATVWAPFVITYQGELAGCGVNQLSLARIEGDWRIVFAMDTGERQETCGDFRARYLAAAAD